MRPKKRLIRHHVEYLASVAAATGVLNTIPKNSGLPLCAGHQRTQAGMVGTAAKCAVASSQAHRKDMGTSSQLRCSSQPRAGTKARLDSAGSSSPPQASDITVQRMIKAGISLFRDIPDCFIKLPAGESGGRRRSRPPWRPRPPRSRSACTAPWCSLPPQTRPAHWCGPWHRPRSRRTWTARPCP